MNALKKTVLQKKKTRITEFLPWAFFGETGIVIQKDGYFQRTYQYRGPDLDCVDQNLTDHHTEELSRTIMRLGANWALFFEAQRTQIREYPSVAHEMDGLAKEIEEERERYFTQADTHYESTYYLTFVYAPPKDSSKKAAGMIGLSTSAEKEITDFLKTTEDIAGILSQLAAVHPLGNSETMTYLHSTISPDWHPFAEPSGFVHLDHALADSPIEVFGNTLRLGDQYLMIVTINDYPSETFAGILNTLNMCQIEFRYVSRYICLDKAESKKRLEAYGKKYYAGRTSMFKFMQQAFSKSNESVGREDVGSMTLENQVDMALVELAQDIIGFGYTTQSIIIQDENYETLTEKASTIKKIVQSAGFTARIETVGCFQAWLGSLPGQVYANIRRPLLSTLNIAHVVPLTSVWTGRKTNEFLLQISEVGAPHLVTATDAQTPFFLNLNPNESDVGHTLIAGPTGAGKSTLIGLLASQWLKYPKSKVIIIDKDRSAENLTLSIGGQYYEPGSGQEVFQPLGHLETEKDRIWATEFIEMLYTLQGISLSPPIREATNIAIQSFSKTKKKEHRTITTFAQTLQYPSPELHSALAPYTVGPYGNIFDAASTSINFSRSRWIMFELAPLMDICHLPAYATCSAYENRHPTHIAH